MQIRAALSRMLPALALAALTLTVGVTIASAGDTFGYDFRAYHGAAARALGGLPVYDLSYEVAGPSGLFLYPPTFVPMILPFGLLPVASATWLWTAVMLAAFAAAVALMPVARRVRWLVVLLAALSWPFAYNIKLGQVGPLLLLVFVLGWRGIERPGLLGAAASVGAAVKLQPAIVLAWAMATRRWSAVAVGCGTIVGLAAAATAIAGPRAWIDYAELIARVSDPVQTPHNFTPGAIAFQAGVAADVATLLQWASTAGVVALLALATLRLAPVPAYLSFVVASQLLSPVLWDHYAVVVLVPVAWLLDRGHRWAALLVLATPVVAVGVVPAVAYPAVLWASLLAVVAIGARTSRTPRRAGRRQEALAP